MVQVLENPVADTQSTTRKRGGGVRTLAGRMKSRENAVKSSLRSKVLFSKDMAVRILDRYQILKEQFQPRTRYLTMLVADMALAKAHGDRAAELLIENEDRNVERTVDFWDHDQSMRALHLRKRLAKNPAWFAHVLSGFKQGAELLISEWERLAKILADGGDWDLAQRTALDLAGVSLVLRPGNLLLAPGLDRVSRDEMAAMAAREIARLRHCIKSWLDDKDLDSQDDSLIGLGFEEGIVTRRLQRYETTSRREYTKAYDEFMRVKAEGEAIVKEKGIPLGPRAWDEDSLMARIQAIKEPPGLWAELKECLGPIRRLDELPEEDVRPAPDAGGQGPGAAAPDTTTPAPAGPAAEAEPAAAESAGEGEGEGQTAVSPADPGTPAQSIVSEQATAETTVIDAQAGPQLSRRRRKLHQRRLHDAGARRPEMAGSMRTRYKRPQAAKGPRISRPGWLRQADHHFLLRPILFFIGRQSRNRMSGGSNDIIDVVRPTAPRPSRWASPRSTAASTHPTHEIPEAV